MKHISPTYIDKKYNTDNFSLSTYSKIIELEHEHYVINELINKYTFIMDVQMLNEICLKLDKIEEELKHIEENDL